MAAAMHHQHHMRMQQQPPDGYKTWICVYPIYINKDKTIAEGRRIKKNMGVKVPVFGELLDAMRNTGLQIVGEPDKIHPRVVSREPIQYGRIRVQIKSDEGEIINEKFQCRDDVYMFLAKTIPQLKSRNQPKPTPEEGKKKGKGKRK